MFPDLALFPAATSPASPYAAKAEAVAMTASFSTAAQAATTEVAMHPVPVTVAIIGCPFAIRRNRAPSVTTSMGPVTAATHSNFFAN